MRRVLGIACIAWLGSGAPLAAQTGSELFDQGLAAYNALEMEAAQRMLRLALAAPDLPEAHRARALAYLGAAEFYRDRRDSALAAFARLVEWDPRYRLDTLTFTPDVVGVFDEARRHTPVVAVTLPPRVVFEPGRGGLGITLVASTPHRVRARIEDASGRAVRTLHDERLSDSLTLSWDGAGARRQRLTDGLYNLSITSFGEADRAVRIVDVPVRLAWTRRDALAPPPAPALLPEREPLGPGLLRLGLGLGSAAAAFAVVPVFTDDNGPRIAIPLVLVAAGVIGFLERRPGRPYPENVVINESRRAAWRARVAEVEAANRRRRPGPRIVLETGRPAVRRR